MKKLILIMPILLMGYVTTIAKPPIVKWQDKPQMSAVDFSYGGNYIGEDSVALSFEKSRQIYLGVVEISNALATLRGRVLKLEITFDVNRYRAALAEDTASTGSAVDSTHWWWKDYPNSKSKLTEMLLRQEAVGAVNVTAYLNARSSYGRHYITKYSCEGAVIVLHAGRDVCTMVCDFTGGNDEYGMLIQRYSSVEGAIRYGFV